MQVISDFHPEFNGYKPIYDLHRLGDILILAGDCSDMDFVKFDEMLEYISKVWKYIIFVPGNHDFHCRKLGLAVSRIDIHYREMFYKRSNTHYLNNDAS
jgi:predicted phosphohydrolase